MPISRPRLLIPRLLILGGTAEAVALAQALSARGDIDFVTSLAGRTKNPHLPPGAVHVGGFGGWEGLADYLATERIDLLVDATHPFATQIGANAIKAALAKNISLLRLLRPAWQRQPGDDWTEIDDMRQAAEHCRGRRVLLAVGQKELRPFFPVADAYFLARMIEQPKEPLALANFDLILSRGPFALDDELRLLKEKRIQLVVAKNSGGDAGYAKIEAARRLHIPIVMVARPKSPRPGAIVPDVPDAIAWIAAWLQTRGSDRAFDPATTASDSP